MDNIVSIINGPKVQFVEIFGRQSGFKLSVESNQAITLVLALILLRFEIIRVVYLLSNWYGLKFYDTRLKIVLFNLGTTTWLTGLCTFKDNKQLRCLSRALENFNLNF